MGFKKKKGGYFSTRKTHLVGIEFPLSYAPHEDYPNVKFKGLLTGYSKFCSTTCSNRSIETVNKYIKTNNRNGWYLQQLIKLYSGYFIPYILDHYLVIDSDVYFLKEIEFIFGTEIQI